MDGCSCLEWMWVAPEKLDERGADSQKKPGRKRKDERKQGRKEQYQTAVI